MALDYRKLDFIVLAVLGKAIGIATKAVSLPRTIKVTVEIEMAVIVGMATFEEIVIAIETEAVQTTQTAAIQDNG